MTNMSSTFIQHVHLGKKCDWMKKFSGNCWIYGSQCPHCIVSKRKSTESNRDFNVYCIPLKIQNGNRHEIEIKKSLFPFCAPCLRGRLMVRMPRQAQITRPNRYTYAKLKVVYLGLSAKFYWALIACASKKVTSNWKIEYFQINNKILSIVII